MIGLLCLLFGLAAVVGVPDDAPRVRLFEFTYRAAIEKMPAGTGKVEVWVPYPQSNQQQEILDVEVKAPEGLAIFQEPKYGNLIVHLTLENPRSSPIEIEMRFKVLRREYVRKDFDRAVNDPAERPDPGVARFLLPSARVPLNDQVREWAEEVTVGKKTDLEKARAIYDYALANLKYDKTGQGWGNGDLLYVCDQKRGNCTDFHALFNGFARAVGIPARFSIGFPLPEERGGGEIVGYHCWSEFYLDGYGWVPIDASEAWKNPSKRDYFFGAHDENRIYFSTGRDLVLRPRQEGAPLNYFIYPYAELDGKPFGQISYHFSFKDLPLDEVASVR
ncbi:MAG: transglutaminase-like domain-containing protein [Acidobacteriota bacterium]